MRVASGATLALAAAEGAAVIILLDNGAAVATAGSCFAVEVTVGNAEDSAAAGCEVETIEPVRERRPRQKLRLFRKPK